jgi:hypothetical protein
MPAAGQPMGNLARRLALYGLALFGFASIPGAPGLFPLESSLFGSDLWALAALAALYVVAVPILWFPVLRRGRPGVRALSTPEWCALGWLTLVFLASVCALGFILFLGVSLSPPWERSV